MRKAIGLAAVFALCACDAHYGHWREHRDSLDPLVQLDDSLLYNYGPESTASTYMQTGDQFLDLGDTGGAARAYWAAVTQINRIRTSRRQKEEQLQHALEKLATVAKKRNQTSWGDILTLCAKLAQTYAEGPEGKAEQAQFDEAKRKAEALRQQAYEQAAAERRAARDQYNQGLMNAANIMNSAGPGASTAEALGAIGGGYGTLLSAKLAESERNEDTATELSTAIGEVDQAEDAVIENADRTFLDVDYDKTFVAGRIAFYLQQTQDAAPYLKVIQESSQLAQWPEAAQLAAKMPLPQKPQVSDITLLARALGKREIETLVGERRHSVYTPIDYDAAIAAKVAAKKKQDELDRAAKAESAQWKGQVAGASKSKCPDMEQWQCESVLKCEAGQEDQCSYATYAFGKNPARQRAWLRARCDAGKAKSCLDMGDLAGPRGNAPDMNAQLYGYQHACDLGNQTGCLYAKDVPAVFAGLELKKAGRCPDDYECQSLAKCEVLTPSDCTEYLNYLVYSKKDPSAEEKARAYCEKGNGSGCMAQAAMIAVAFHTAHPKVQKFPDDVLEKYSTFVKKACDLKFADGCFTWALTLREHNRSHSESDAAFDAACKGGVKQACPEELDKVCKGGTPGAFKFCRTGVNPGPSAKPAAAKQ